MNFAEFSIKKNIITWTMTVVVLVMGYIGYNSLARLEDPEFAIKQAVVITPYVGASAEEVAREVTEKIEKAVQELGQLKRVESYSQRGFSTVKVVIKDKYQKPMLPDVWDELRRKILDYQSELPPGAGPSLINDDFGDVYGVYLALNGQGFSYAELKKIAELLKREFLTVPGVKKVVFFGEQQEVVYVEMSKLKMSALNITRNDIFDALSAKNIPVDVGHFKSGTEWIPINPTGLFTSEKQFGDLLISSKSGKLIYLKDVANINRDYQDPPKKILQFNGNPSIGIAISTIAGGNAVTMGEGIDKRLGELMNQIPVGMDLGVIAMQSDVVTEAIDGFIINLIEAVFIVIFILLLTMGLRSGLIIGFILVLTIAATFFVMSIYEITLERISLGALIIALGMLVDNAIVVVDGMKVKMEQGMDGLKAATEVVGQNSIPLLGATVVAVLAFASIGTLTNNTGEYTQSLYYVILISLSLSWLTAVTTTPLITKLFILPKKKKKTDKKATDPYGGGFYLKYKFVLVKAIRHRWITIAIVVGLFGLSLFGFGFLKNMFFPPSTAPQFMVEIQFREGTHIRDTQKNVNEIEEYFRSVDGVTDIASAIGSGHSRFILTYTVPVDASTNYTSILVSVEEFEIIDQISHKTQSDIEEMFPDATINVKKFLLGPGEGGKIQLRILGPDPAVLRQLAETTKNIIRSDPGSKAVRDEWGTKVKVIQPVIADDRARRQGISRAMVGQAIKGNFEGVQTGVYREDIEIIPIVARAPLNERMTLENMSEMQLYSPLAGKEIPIRQIVTGIETVSEDARISGWNRTTMIKVHGDARTELASTLFARLKPKIEIALGVDTELYMKKSFGPPEDPYRDYTGSSLPIKYDDKIPLKAHPGYYIAWGGEAEDSADAVGQLAAAIPIFFGMMILVVIFLFNAFKQPAVIWLTVPLSLIGVVLGLLIFDEPFGFMALLGLMSLSGMLIKNAIVLIDEIDTGIRKGKDHYDAIVDAGLSRMSPVSLAAATTMMGMIPLFLDAFFISMAVTIVFGLGFATVLTLIFVPTLYATLFKIYPGK